VYNLAVSSREIMCGSDSRIKTEETSGERERRAEIDRPTIPAPTTTACIQSTGCILRVEERIFEE
jgi:hypothetical protein